MEHLILAQIGLEGAESFLRAVLYFIITIFILVSVHEFGHFIAGRIFKMRVPVFSVGMGRRLFGFNKINGFTLGNLEPETEIQLENKTDYRLSLLPIGGYAKIEGMIDETQNEALPEEVKPWEFRAKPWWQKSIVISAGVIMNTLLAWAIFSSSHFIYGAETPATTTIGAVEHGSISEDDGVRLGDKIVTIADKKVTNWLDIDQVVSKNFGHDFSMTFERNGKIYSALYRASSMGTFLDLSKRFGLEPVGFSSPYLDSVVPKSPAALAGLQKGDTIVAVGGIATPNSAALIDQISSHAQKPLSLDIIRHGTHQMLMVTPDAKGTIGVMQESSYSGPKATIHYGFMESAGMGLSDLWSYTRLTVISISQIIEGKMAVSSALGGPIKIAQFASKSAAGGLETFMGFMAMLSISLALINILPIPALDGGHLLIILVEAAIGHELSQRFKLNFQKVGIAILLFLMVFMIFNDIRSL